MIGLDFDRTLDLLLDLELWDGFIGTSCTSVSVSAPDCIGLWHRGNASLVF